MNAISYHDTVNDLHGLGLSGKGPFACLDWFRLLQEAGHKPLLATIRDGDEAICLPLMQGDSGLQVLTNWYAFTWEPMATPNASPALYAVLATDLAKKSSRITLSKLPDEDGMVTMLEAAFRGAGWRVLREEHDTNHILEVSGRSYAEYLAARPGRLRTTLKRKAKKVEVRLTREFDAADWAAYEEIYRQSWKPEEGEPAMLRSFAESESKAGHFLFGLALADGEPVAAQFWSVVGGTAYIHKLAHLESAQKLSPGSTLTAALFAEAIDQDKAQLVDFGTGNDPYKADWMEAKRPRYSLTCLRPEAPRNWPLMAKTAIRKLVSKRSAS